MKVNRNSLSLYWGKHLKYIVLISWFCRVLSFPSETQTQRLCNHMQSSSVQAMNTYNICRDLRMPLKSSILGMLGQVYEI